MSFDRDTYAALMAEHGPVVRVVVADTKGSVPRDVGASIVVWATGQSGTIGGGTLEFDAVDTARRMIDGDTKTKTASLALGPDMGQCCGGRVRLLWERLDALPEGDIVARPVTASGEEPLAVKRLRARVRDRGDMPSAAYIDGWLVEPVTTARTPVWIWGAGHVGRALVSALTPLPGLAITWVDTGPERFPDEIPNGVTALPAPEIADAARFAPRDAHHIVMTYSHALDLAICDGLLTRGFASAGLIGSDTKWVRFRKRLTEAGHQNPARIQCPIGDKRLGKHPAAIALGVAHDIMGTVNAYTVEHEGNENDRRLSVD